MVYVRNLGFTQDPDYFYLRGIFRQLFMRCGFADSNLDFVTKDKIKPGKKYYCPGEDYEDNYGVCDQQVKQDFWTPYVEVIDNGQTPYNKADEERM